MKLSTLQHDLLSNTHFKIEIINIGNFWPSISKMAPLDECVLFQELPVVQTTTNEKFGLVNHKNYALQKNLSSTIVNFKTPVLKIIKSDLSLSSLEDIFWVDSLKHTPVKKRYDEIFNIIISDNYLLKKLCPNIISQVSYINNNFLPDRIGSRKLAEINKSVDLELCKNRLMKKGLSNNETEQLHILFYSQNKKMLFLDFIRIFNHLSTLKYSDIKLALDYFTKNEAFYIPAINTFEDFLHQLIKRKGNNFTYTELIALLYKIDASKQKENKNYNFINDTLKAPDADIESIGDFICKYLK